MKRGLPGRRRQRESGQTAVEAAITLPLVIFVILGTLQLFMMLQARILAQYAAYKAVRVGSISKGDCVAMTQAASAALLPAVTRTDGAANFLAAYQSRLSPTNKIPVYTATADGFDAPLVQIVIDSPQVSQIRRPPEDVEFDDPNLAPGNNYELGIHMAIWYRMKIPFANWVMSKMFLVRNGLSAPPTRNPLMPPQNSPPGWSGPGRVTSEYYPGQSLASRMQTLAGSGIYVYPIQVTAAMPMMTPPATKFIGGCP